MRFNSLRPRRAPTAYQRHLAAAKRASGPFFILPVLFNVPGYLPLASELFHLAVSPLMALAFTAAYLALSGLSWCFGLCRYQAYLRDHPFVDGRRVDATPRAAG